MPVCVICTQLCVRPNVCVWVDSAKSLGACEWLRVCSPLLPSCPLTSLWNTFWQCKPHSSISYEVGKGVREAPAVGFEPHSICPCKGSKVHCGLAFLE